MQKLYSEIEFLASVPMLKNWSFNEIKNLYYNLSIAKYRRGQIVYHQGQESTMMYIIRSGDFKVFFNL